MGSSRHPPGLPIHPWPGVWDSMTPIDVVKAAYGLANSQVAHEPFLRAVSPRLALSVFEGPQVTSRCYACVWVSAVCQSRLRCVGPVCRGTRWWTGSASHCWMARAWRTWSGRTPSWAAAMRHCLGRWRRAWRRGTSFVAGDWVLRTSVISQLCLFTKWQLPG